MEPVITLLLKLNQWTPVQNPLTLCAYNCLYLCSRIWLKIRSENLQNFLINRLLEIHSLLENLKILVIVTRSWKTSYSHYLITRIQSIGNHGTPTRSTTCCGIIHDHSPNSAFSIPSPTRFISSSFPVNLRRNLSIQSLKFDKINWNVNVVLKKVYKSDFFCRYTCVDSQYIQTFNLP